MENEELRKSLLMFADVRDGNLKYKKKVERDSKLIYSFFHSWINYMLSLDDLSRDLDGDSNIDSIIEEGIKAVSANVGRSQAIYNYHGYYLSLCSKAYNIDQNYAYKCAFLKGEALGICIIKEYPVGYRPMCLPELDSAWSNGDLYMLINSRVVSRNYLYRVYLNGDYIGEIYGNEDLHSLSVFFKKFDYEVDSVEVIGESENGTYLSCICKTEGTKTKYTYTVHRISIQEGDYVQGYF